MEKRPFSNSQTTGENPDVVQEIKCPQTYRDIQDGEQTRGGYYTSRSSSKQGFLDKVVLNKARVALAALTLTSIGIGLGTVGRNTVVDHLNASERDSWATPLKQELHGEKEPAPGHKMYKDLIVLEGVAGVNPAVRSFPREYYGTGDSTLITRAKPGVKISEGMLVGDNLVYDCRKLADKTVHQKTKPEDLCVTDGGLVRGIPVKK